MRDLNSNDISLLEKINEKATKSIEEHFGILDINLRAYVHYIPSIFRFHVHFVHSKCCGGTTSVMIFLYFLIFSLGWKSKFIGRCDL